MKIKVAGVRSMPKSGCFVVIADLGDYQSEKCITYGINPREIWCRNMELLKTAVEAIGSEVDVLLDLSRNIEEIIA